MKTIQVCNEVERMIRKIRKVGFDGMIEKETTSYGKNKMKKDKQVRKSKGLSE